MHLFPCRQCSAGLVVGQRWTSTSDFILNVITTFALAELPAIKFHRIHVKRQRFAFSLPLGLRSPVRLVFRYCLRSFALPRNLSRRFTGLSWALTYAVILPYAETCHGSVNRFIVTIRHRSRCRLGFCAKGTCGHVLGAF
jgi:hypothetical protein